MQSQTDLMQRANLIIPGIGNMYTLGRWQNLHVGELKWTCRMRDYNGWMVCDGRELSITEYQDLYNVIGTSFGGDCDTFRIPDTRSKVMGVIGSSGSNTHFMGEMQGEETHQLTIDEMPTHTHDGYTTNNGSHNHGGVTGAGGDAIESESVSNFGGGAAVSGTGTHSHTIPTEPDHYHTYITNVTGGSNAHNNMQPTLFVGNVLIFTGKDTPVQPINT